MTVGAKTGIWQTAFKMFAMHESRAMFAGRRKTRLAILAVVLIGIPIWQVSFFAERQNLSDEYRISKSFGAAHQLQFIYFFHTLGIYPLGIYPMDSREIQRDLTPGAAESLLRTNAHSLSVDKSWDRVGIFLLLPHIYFGGDIRNPSFVPANAILLCIALMALFASFWTVRLEVLGLATVVFVGSGPMLLYEVFVYNNLFALSITIGLMVLAIHLPFVATHRYFLVARGKTWRHVFLWSAPILTGFLTATFGGARMPAATAIAAVVLILAVHQGFPRLQRLSLIGLLCGTFFFTFSGWNLYFDRLTEHSIDYAGARGVENVNPKWRIQRGSPFWHNIVAGLGDFDDKYGYLWADEPTYYLASPSLGRELPIHDSSVVYLPRYSDVVRNHVLGNILRDPMWFARIVGKRIWVSVFQNSPPQLAYGTGVFSLPVHPVPFAIVVGAILVMSVVARAWGIVGIALILIAAGATAIVNTSAGGFRYVMIVHQFMYALIPVLALEVLLILRRRNSLPSEPDTSVQRGTTAGPPTDVEKAA